MKKLTRNILLILCIAVLSVFVLAGCTALPEDFGNNAQLAVDCNTAYDTLRYIGEYYPDRTSGYSYYKDGTRQEPARDFALWIGDKLANLGYERTFSTGDGLQSFTYSNSFTERNDEVGYNVAYTKKGTSSDKKIIISAAYDNVANLPVSGKIIGGDGTYNNATGVVALLEAARALANEQLPFDVDFVAFGAKEVGYYGSSHYLRSMTEEERNNILLMINFDRAAGGDYVYMYSSEAETDHNRYFYDKAEENSLAIAPLPNDMRNVLMTVAGSNLPYYNEGMLSDNLTFGQSGIPYVNFFSMNLYDRASAGAIERKGMTNIQYTSNDTFTNFESRLGGAEQAESIINGQISNIVSTVVYALRAEDFVTVMENTEVNGGKDWMLNGTVMSIVTYSVLGGLILLFVILYFSLRQSTLSHKVYIDTPYGRLDMDTRQIIPNNVQPQQKNATAEDIFGLGKSEQDKTEETQKSDNVSSKNDANGNDTDIFGDY